MGKSVTKSDLVTTMATAADIKKVQAEKALTALTDAVRIALGKGKKVTLVGFGTFVVTTRAARMGKNPQTKKPMKIPPSKAVRFRAGRAFKDSVNG